MASDSADTEPNAIVIQRAIVYTLLGPLNFLNGLPEYGPRRPNTLALICGLVGTWLWFSVFHFVVTILFPGGPAPV